MRKVRASPRFSRPYGPVKQPRSSGVYVRGAPRAPAGTALATHRLRKSGPWRCRSGAGWPELIAEIETAMLVTAEPGGAAQSTAPHAADGRARLCEFDASRTACESNLRA